MPGPGAPLSGKPRDWDEEGKKALIGCIRFGGAGCFVVLVFALIVIAHLAVKYW